MNVTRKIWPVGQGAFYTEQLQVGDNPKKNTFNRALLNNLHPHLAFCCYGSDNGYNHPGYCLLHKFRRKLDCCVFPMDENASCIEQSLGFY